MSKSNNFGNKSNICNSINYNLRIELSFIDGRWLLEMGAGEAYGFKDEEQVLRRVFQSENEAKKFIKENAFDSQSEIFIYRFEKRRWANLLLKRDNTYDLSIGFELTSDGYNFLPGSTIKWIRYKSISRNEAIETISDFHISDIRENYEFRGFPRLLHVYIEPFVERNFIIIIFAVIFLAAIYQYLL
ncbi:MAG: hypothetical protein ACQEUZ_00775 [Pseudomonadota bacterium]